MAKQHRRRPSRRRSKRRNGGGFSTGPSSVAVGYAEITPYSGAGKDCPSDQPLHRFGEITSFSPKGLPGMSGGRRRRHSHGTRRRYGGAPLAVADQLGAPLVTMSMPGVPVQQPQPQPQPQKGGTYQTILSGPLASNGVGGSAPAGIESISCGSRYPSTMRGGAADLPSRMEVGSSSDMAVYHAQNAGYTNQAVSVPGAAPIMAQVGYPAGHFNRACMTTGGGLPLESAELQPISMKDLGDRYDFDGTHGGLPVRFGGRRRHRRHSRRTRKH